MIKPHDFTGQLENVRSAEGIYIICVRIDRLTNR